MENEICETKSFEKCVVHFSLNIKVTKKIILKTMILIVTVLTAICLIAFPKCRDVESKCRISNHKIRFRILKSDINSSDDRY